METTHSDLPWSCLRQSRATEAVHASVGEVPTVKRSDAHIVSLPHAPSQLSSQQAAELCLCTASAGLLFLFLFNGWVTSTDQGISMGSPSLGGGWLEGAAGTGRNRQPMRTLEAVAGSAFTMAHPAQRPPALRPWRLLELLCASQATASSRLGTSLLSKAAFAPCPLLPAGKRRAAAGRAERLSLCSAAPGWDAQALSSSSTPCST